MDSLHVGLVLAGAVLLGTVLTGYEHIVKHSSEEWLASMARVQEKAGTNVALHEQLMALRPGADAGADTGVNADAGAEAEATTWDVAGIGPDVGEDSEEVADLKVRIDEARRVYYREVMREADRGRDVRHLVGLRWFVWGACLLALGLTVFGWSRWLRSSRAPRP